MSDRHFGQTEDHDQRNKTRYRIAYEHGGAGVTNCNATAHEKTRADCTAESNHHDLCLTQRFLETVLPLCDLLIRQLMLPCAVL
jgi:hypothetical protein